MFGLRPGRISKLGIVGGGSGRRPSLALDFTGPQAVVNLIRNSTMTGAIAGTPGTTPTGWSGWAITNGLSTSVIATGNINGLSYIDVRLFGTTVSGTFTNLGIGAAADTLAAVGQTFDHSVYLSIIGGSIANLTSISMGVGVSSSSLAYLGELTARPDIKGSLSAALTRFNGTGTIAFNTAAVASPYIQFTYGASAVIDITLRIASPQLELGAVANAWVPTTSAANSNIDSRITTVRAAGGATVMDNTGTLALVPANVARVSYNPARQKLANTTGIVDPGLNLNAISVGVVPPVFAGTAVVSHTRIGAGDDNEGFSGTTPPIVGATLVASIYVWIPSAWAGTDVRVVVAGGGISPNTVANLGLRDQWQRIQVTGTTISGGLVNIVLRSAASAGQVFYSTGWQLEYGSVATVYQPSVAGIVTTASLGLLIEEQRTNSIRNPRLEGSSPGTPGTMPTNVQIGNANGLTTSLVGSGYENGIPYIDVSFVGTTTGSGANIAFENANIIAASVGQTWSNSFYCRLVGGSLTNITAIQCEMFTIDAGAGFLNVYATSMTPPTAAPLSTQRAIGTFTIAEATTAFVQTLTQINTGTGVAVNVTLRLGLPQTELGAFVTSPISPVSGTPTATTRIGEVITTPTTGSWFKSGPFSIEAEYSAAGSAGNRIVQLDDGTANNQTIFFLNSALASSNNLIIAGVNQGRIDAGPAFVAGTTYKAANSLAPTKRSIAVNGGTVVTSAAGPTSTPYTVLRFGANEGSAAQLNGYLRKVNYWPRALTDIEIQAVST